jgi:hypothetical protein
MAAVGRKAIHFKALTGDTIKGLVKQKDGRYRVLATGQRFTADSEAEAIQKFYRLAPKPETVDVPSKSTWETEGGRLWERTNTPGEDFWPWLRNLLTTRLAEVAMRTNLPGLASLDLTAVPKDAIKIVDITAAECINGSAQKSGAMRDAYKWACHR